MFYWLTSLFSSNHSQDDTSDAVQDAQDSFNTTRGTTALGSILRAIIANGDSLDTGVDLLNTALSVEFNNTTYITNPDLVVIETINGKTQLSIPKDSK